MAAALPLPDTRLLALAALWLTLGLAAVWQPEWQAAWQWSGVAAGALALADALAGSRRRGRLRVARRVAHTLPVGTWQPVHLRVEALAPVSGWLRDCHPAGFSSQGLPCRFALAGGQRVEAAYRLHLAERGPEQFSGVDLRLNSPLRLWLVPETLACPQTVRVYPDFARVSHYALLATDHRLSQWGVLHRRRRGEGLEFHQLRDYRQEDAPRSIDWKASARVGRLIAREYQDERDQQVVFLLDCSQRMRARDDTLSHFDHTLNALLLLAYVALDQGDAVGLATFGHEAPRYLPPKKSGATLNRLLNAVYDLQPGSRSPDLLEAAEYLTRRLARRAFVVLVTNLRDEDDDTLRPAMQLLGRRHAVSVASLREPALEARLAAPLEDFDAALEYAAALQYSAGRRRQAALLRKAGARVLDVAPADLPIALVNHYWERKRSGNL